MSLENPVFTVNEYQQVINSIPEHIQEQLKTNDIIVAGGFIRDILIDLPVSDLDIFCKTEEVAKKLADYSNDGLGILKTDCSYSILHNDLKVQYIYCRPYTTPESLINEFDFTCCGVSLKWMGGRWDFSYITGFEEDTRDMVLVFRNADYNKGNLGALSRAFRFTAKGWFLPQVEMAKIVHHYIAYSPDIRNANRAFVTDTRRVSVPSDGDYGTFTSPDDSPLVSLATVQRSVNPRYNPRNQNGR